MPTNWRVNVTGIDTSPTAANEPTGNPTVTVIPSVTISGKFADKVQFRYLWQRCGIEIRPIIPYAYSAIGGAAMYTTATALLLKTISMGDGLTVVIDTVQPSTWQSLSIMTSGTLPSAATYEAQIYSGGTLVASTGIPVNGTVSVAFVPTTSSITLNILQTSLARGSLYLDSITLPHVDSFGTSNVVTTVCNEDKYHYGYNGKTKDNEWAGVGNHYDYGVRGYDPRICRFISGDPLAKKYPFWSPYAFAGNSPIYAVDLDGFEIRNAYYNYSNDGTRTTIKDPNNKEVADFVDKQIAALQNDDQALYDYLNKYPIDVTVGNLPKQGEGADYFGHIDIKVETETDKLNFEEAYNMDHGEGAFSALWNSDVEKAKAYRAAYEKGEPRVVTKQTIVATITLDKKTIDEVNAKADNNEKGYDIRDKNPDGKVLKHEAGHFLFDTKAKIPDPEKSENEAKRIENTFDGNPKTQTDVDKYNTN